MLYTGENLKEISFPLGGIGTGCIGLAGNGSLIDFEIENRPNKNQTPGHTFFAIRAEEPNGKVTAKILQGDRTEHLVGTHSPERYHGFGFGPEDDTMCAFPHFKNVTFKGEFPMAVLEFHDEDFPADVVMTAFNPFIPLDADNSSLPAAFFNIDIKSKKDGVKYTVLFVCKNTFEQTTNEKVNMSKITAIHLKNSAKNPDEIGYGDTTVAVDCCDGIYQEYLYRGIWKDKITVFWHEFLNNELGPRHYEQSAKDDVALVGAEANVNCNESKNFRFVFAWNVPNNYNYWTQSDETSEKVLWKNYYATLFDNSAATAKYAFENWDMLYEKTNLFKESLHSQTLDPAVIDAVSSNLSVLKSPTVLRLEDGSFYGWEGLHEKEGSCEGTCTHVWSYAYALCFLFPDLERSIRNVEFKYDVNEHGAMGFRTQLPIGSGSSCDYPCVDGQMASVFKTYREWKISGDDEWLKECWPTVKKILEFAWNENNPNKWDLDKDGVLEGRQHHTLDMELFGPSSWLQGMYLAALKAAIEMAEYLGEIDKANEYAEICDKGYDFVKNNLFNGEYFYHKVDLTNKDLVESFQCSHFYWNDEKNQIKYQIGEGCEIDQMLGQWHAHLCGLGRVFDKAQCHVALQSMLKYNFKDSMRNFANAWRVFAINDEQGAIMCDYPSHVNRPIIPIPYTDECMTGFEYAFAGLLISEGFVQEGLKVVKAIRDRYDGKKRNPYNEIECGSNYARSMASYALIPIFSGFEYDMPRKYIGFTPVSKENGKFLWSVGSGWGELIQEQNNIILEIKDGSLSLESVKLGNVDTVKKVIADNKELAYKFEDHIVRFEKSTIKSKIIFEVSL